MSSENKLSVSVVVRTKNEEATAGQTLQAIASQSLLPDEIILVDNNSSDKTVEIAGQYCTQVITFKDAFPMGFYNHAHGCNLGASYAKGEVVVFTNGHSTPVSNKWLEAGLSHFADERVAGCSGYQYSLQPTLIDRVRTKVRQQIIKPGLQDQVDRWFLKGLGLLNTVTGAIRKDLWQKYPFDERFSQYYGGGEDKDWAFYFYQRGYRFVVEPRFSVYHSHQGSFREKFYRQFDYFLMYWGAYNRYKHNLLGREDARYCIPPSRTSYGSNLATW